MEWKEVRLGDVCTRVCSGGTPKSTNLSYYGGEIPWLNTKEIDFNRIYSTEKTITDSGLSNSSAKWIVPNTVSVAMYGATAGKSCIVKVPMTTNQACCNLTINEEVADYEFVYYTLKNDYTTLASLANGGAQQNLNAQIIKDYVLQIPSLAGQHRIASILSSLDRKIELNNKINADLEEMAQAIFKNWFIDFEPFKDGKFVDSELGMIPEGWKVVKMGDFFPVKTGKKDANTASVNGKYPFFSCSQNALCTDSYSFDCDAILVAGNGDFNVKWYSGKFDAYQRTYVLIPYNKKLLALLYYVVKRNLLTITSKARGSVIRFITKGNLTDFEFAIPRDLENNEIVDVFESINEKIFANNKENSRLSLLRDTLLPRLMSGELEVPD